MKTKEIYDYDVNERINELGIELKELKNPNTNNYVHSVLTNSLLFLSGKVSQKNDGRLITGKVGKELTTQQGYEAARLSAINQLSALKTALGDLNKVEKIVKVFGMVNAVPNYTEHALVINGFSDLIVEVFGERGRHARTGIGVSSLPVGVACEVEMIVQVKV